MGLTGEGLHEPQTVVVDWEFGPIEVHLGAPALPPRQVRLRVDGGYIQWQLAGDAAWQNLVALADLRGVPGNRWHLGEGQPGGETGLEGDLYLDTASGVFYRKEGGTWLPQGTLGGSPARPGLTRNFALTAHCAIDPSPTPPYTDAPRLAVATSDGPYLSYARRGKLQDGDIALGAAYNSGAFVGWRYADPVVAFDLGQPRELAAVNVYGLLDSPLGIHRPVALTVECSDDGFEWTVAARAYELDPGVGVGNWAVCLDVSGSHQHWRVQIASGGEWLFVSEVELLGVS